MKPPPGTSYLETPLTTMWFEKKDLFCSVTKKGSLLNMEGLQQTFEYIRAHAGEKKVCWLGDVTDAPPANKAVREYAAKETPHVVKALALITNSTFSRLLAELFMLVQKPPYPVKLFSNEESGRQWLEDYLD
jgi:hypothetical protein